jgi:hypothetical protein
MTIHPLAAKPPLQDSQSPPAISDANTMRASLTSQAANRNTFGAAVMGAERR